MRLLAAFSALATVVAHDLTEHEPRRTAVSVNDEASLNAAIASYATIDLTTNIAIKATINIADIKGLAINGNGYAIDGGSAVQIFKISGKDTTVSMRQLTVRYGRGGALESAGGIGITAASVNLEGVNVQGCDCSQAKGYVGGALSAQDKAVVTMSNCVFNDNQANNNDKGAGGAIMVEDSTVACTNGAFRYNYAGENGGSTIGSGAGLFVRGGSNVVVRDTSFQGNKAQDSDSGCIYVEAAATKAVVNTFSCIFDENENLGKNPGAAINVAAVNAEVDVVGAKFVNNKGSTEGTDVFVATGSKVTFNSECPSGEYSNSVGTVSCIGCTGDAPSDATGPTCADCPEGQYSCCGAVVCVKDKPAKCGSCTAFGLTDSPTVQPTLSPTFMPVFGMQPSGTSPTTSTTGMSTKGAATTTTTKTEGSPSQAASITIGILVPLTAIGLCVLARFLFLYKEEVARKATERSLANVGVDGVTESPIGEPRAETSSSSYTSAAAPEALEKPEKQVQLV